MKIINIAYSIYNAGEHQKNFDFNKGLDRLIEKDKDGIYIYRAGMEWKEFDYKKGLKALKNSFWHKEALKNWPKGIKASQKISKDIKSKAKTLPMKTLKLESLNEMKVLRTKKSAYDIYKAGMRWKKSVYNEHLDDLIKADKEGYIIFLAGKDWKSFDFKKGLKALKNTKYYRHALEEWPRGIEQSQAKSKQIKSKAKILPMKKLRLKEDIDLDKMSVTKIYKASFEKQKGFDYKKGLNALIKKDKTGEYIYLAGVDWEPFDYKKASKALIKIDKKGGFIYYAGGDWKDFDYDKGLEALKNTEYYERALKLWPRGIEISKIISKDIKDTSKKLPMKTLKLEAAMTKIEDFKRWARFQSIEYIINAGKIERPGFDYNLAPMVLYVKMRKNGYELANIRDVIINTIYKKWPKKYIKSIKARMAKNNFLKFMLRSMMDIEDTQKKSKQIRDTAKKLPMKTLKLEDITSKNLSSLAAEKIYDAGIDKKNFDFKKGLDDLIKTDETGENIYYAGKHWKSFNYEKGMKAISLLRASYHKLALKYWPKDIKTSIKISKDIKSKAKILPKKTLKLENVEYLNKMSSYEICRAGKDWKSFDYEKGFEALIKKDKTGNDICNAGIFWKKFDFKKGLEALIKVDKTGNNICNAGIFWKKFDYEKALKALKNNAYYKKALKQWPKGIKASQEISKDIKDKAKVLHMKPLRLKEEAFTEIQYLNKSFFYDLKRVFRAVKKMDKPEKTKRLGFYLQALRKIQGNQKNIDRIIRDVFEKKQELSPESVINKLKIFETPAGKKLYVKPETAYQTTQRLVSSQKLNKTISVSIFGEIYDEILDKYKNKPGGDDIIRSINRYISGHFTDAAAFIRWTNMSKDWTHIDAFQTDFFSKIKVMGNQDENFKKVADEIRAKEDEYWKTAMSYILRTNTDKKVWTANTEDLVKAVENVRGEVKLKQYYHKLPKLLGFKLITMDKLKQILRTRPGEETEKKITTLEKAVGSHIKPKTIGIENYGRITKNIGNAIKALVKAANQKDKEKITKQQIDTIINSYTEGDLASAFHQHLDAIHDSANKGTDIELSNYLAKKKPHIVKFLKEKAALSVDVKIWWANRGMLFENMEYKNILVENKIDRIIGSFIENVRRHI